MVENPFYWRELPETPSRGAFPAVPDIIGSYYRYTFIDHGAQFRIYKVSALDGTPTGRVLKVPLDYDETLAALGPHLQRLGHSEQEIVKRVHNLMIHKQELPGLMEGIQATDKRLMRALGGLQIVPLLATVPKDMPDYFMPLYFSQDYVTPMSIFLHQFRLAYLPPRRIKPYDIRTIKQLLRKLVNLHYTLWEYGIFEMSLKIENMGVQKRRGKIELILLDAGEYTTDLEEATTILNKQRWRHSLNTQKTDHLFLPTVLHKMYIEILGEAFTEAALRQHWRKRSKQIERRVALKLRFKQLTSINAEASVMAWVKRQTLQANLTRDIPLSRIDTLAIPHNELTLLLMDKRINRTPETTINALERAERHAFNDHTGHDIAVTAFRHILSQKM